METTIFNGHISGLILDYVIKIPETIGLLSKLKYLSIENSKELSVLPNSIKDLRNLRYLYFCETGLMKLPNFIAELPKLRYIGLQGIKLNSIPEWVKKKARKYHSLRYIKEGVNRDDAYVLGLLEILIGVCIDNVRKKVIEDDISYHKLQKSLHLQTAESKTDIKSKIDNEDYIKSQIEEYFYDAHGTKFYKINEEGHVTGISITAYEGSISLKFIPEEIGNLKYLKVKILNLKKGNFMKKHFTSTVFIINDEKILLIHHKKMNVWLPPGGHVEENEIPSDTAIR
ncbi:hypothetical protein LCGC14_2345830, partial [marine sediment metagenome]